MANGHPKQNLPIDSRVESDGKILPYRDLGKWYRHIIENMFDATLTLNVCRRIADVNKLQILHDAIFSDDFNAEKIIRDHFSNQIINNISNCQNKAICYLNRSVDMTNWIIHNRRPVPEQYMTIDRTIPTYNKQ